MGILNAYAESFRQYPLESSSLSIVSFLRCLSCQIIKFSLSMTVK
ncbi:conserved hypothetical protein [Microcystis aeruginosa PCC 9432]|uniref:Uncharacterized protein n=2 Tax=Microcystis aeruginosa TaxID=1126 RepID=I4GZG3_MICAE|nr:conserved hypothetical protein [Microcystis aeruginosa PCC 9432]CCI15187.1 conserved hypothetical protein [Microcystis aeruginosa PCC 9806]